MCRQGGREHTPTVQLFRTFLRPDAFPPIDSLASEASRLSVIDRLGPVRVATGSRHFKIGTWIASRRSERLPSGPAKHPHSAPSSQLPAISSLSSFHDVYSTRLGGNTGEALHGDWPTPSKDDSGIGIQHGKS